MSALMLRQPLLVAAGAVALSASAVMIPAAALAASPGWAVTPAEVVSQTAEQIRFVVRVVNDSDDAVGGIEIEAAAGAAIECPPDVFMPPGTSTDCTITASLGGLGVTDVTVPLTITGYTSPAEERLEVSLDVTETWEPTTVPMTELVPAKTTVPMTELVPAKTTVPMTEPEPAKTTVPMTELVPAKTTVPMTELVPATTTRPTDEPRPTATPTPTPMPTPDSQPTAGRPTPAVASAPAKLAVTGGAMDIVWPIVGVTALAGGVLLVIGARRRVAKGDGQSS